MSSRKSGSDLLPAPHASKTKRKRVSKPWKNVPVTLRTGGDLLFGEPIRKRERVLLTLPDRAARILDGPGGEILLRARGWQFEEFGINDGDFLVVEPRPDGSASNGELVIAQIQGKCFVGRWWSKWGEVALVKDGLINVLDGVPYLHSDDPRPQWKMRVFAVINQIVRLQDEEPRSDADDAHD